MVNPRHMFRTLNTNPVALAEIAYLRDHIRSLLHWRYFPLHLLFAVAAFAALLPFWFYITVDYTRLLAAIATLVFAVQIILCLRTALVAAHTLRREFSNGGWAALSTGEYHARQIVLGKWWAAVCTTWRPHVFLALLRLGLALGIAQHEYDAVDQGVNGQPVNILSLSYAMRISRFTDIDPQPEPGKIVLACLLVTFYSLAGVGLTALLGLTGAFVARLRHVNTRWFVATLYGLALAAVLITITPLNSRLAAGKHYYLSPPSAQKLQVLKLQTAISELASLADGGVIIAANVLRPPMLLSLNIVRGAVALAVGGSLWTVLFVLLLALTVHLASKSGLRPAPCLVDWTAQRRRWRSNPLCQEPRTRRFRTLPTYRWSNVFLLVLFSLTLAILIASPWRNPPCHNTETIGWFAAIAGGFQLLIAFRTLYLAIHAMHHTANHTGWHPLVLTGIDARRIVFGKGRTVFADVWFFHLLAAALKLAFMYNLAAHLYGAYFSPQIPLVAAMQSLYPYSGMRKLWCPQTPYNMSQLLLRLDSSVIASWALIAAAFAILEATLLIAVGFISALLVRKHITLQIAAGFLLRVLPVLPLLIMWYPLDRQMNIHRDIMFSRCQGGAPNCAEHLEAHQWQRIFDTLQVALATSIDGGITAINLSQFDTPPYRLRQWTGYLLGFGSYVLLTLLALHTAERLAVRRGALPPAKNPT